MSWLKQIIITVVALHVMFAPDVCLMLCCHAPSAVAETKDESHLPPCHRKQAQKDKSAMNTTAAPVAFHAPCTHSHDAKPAARQRTNDESSWSLLSVVLVATPFAWPTKSLTHATNLSLIQPTVSPPFRERNLPLRI